MSTFIKVTEIWVPNRARTQLELKNGIYGQFDDFKSASANKTFAYQKGLPGTVWAQGHPVVITSFENSYFQRTDAAHKAGLTCAIGIPVMSGEFLTAVIVFLCGGKEKHSGAIEVWANDPDRSNELGVVDGYYGTDEYFEFTSRKTKIMKGFGLPGMVWESQLPLLIEDLGTSASFIRGRDARKAGIKTGIGIPVVMNQLPVYIMTFLSARDTPIARHMQIWEPDESRETLECKVSFGEQTPPAELTAKHRVSKGQGLLGQVWLSGVPAIRNGDSGTGKTGTPDVHSVLAMPVIENCALKAIVTFML